MAGILMLSCGHIDFDSNGGMCCLIWYKLSEEMIIEVLCHLLDKPLVQFKSVSKSWNSLIANVCIPKLSAFAPISGFIFSTISYRGGNGFLTTDGCYEPDMINSYVQTDMHLFGTMHGGLVGYFNGLFLFSSNFNGPHMRYFVHNPATKQCVSIPVNPMHQKEAFVGMAFDMLYPYPNTSFKIVRICRSLDNASVLPDFDVFSSVTGEWVSLTNPLHPQIIGSKWATPSLYLKGKFYLLSFSGQLLCFDLDVTDDNRLSACAYKLPVKNTTRSNLCLGSICLSNESVYYYNNDKVSIDIWLLEVGGNKTSYDWIPKFSINIDKVRQLSCGEHLSSSFIPYMVDPASGVIYIGNGDVKVVLKYNLQTNKLELFHQLMDTRIVNGRRSFYPYRRCLVRLPEFAEKCIVW